ncbi:MAG: hypothetical protein ACJ76N_21180 [Thermoanaerobaculia bacterium]
MKSHELARALGVLAKILRTGPNAELDSLTIAPEQRAEVSVEAALSLTTLLDLSRFDKSEWIKLIEQHKLPISVSRKDSARNIIGKIVAYLEEHPETLEEVKQSTRRGAAASPELLKAFSSLFREDQ